jgi:uncharacterized protein
MAKEGRPESSGLDGIAGMIGGAARTRRGPPPVHLWNPPFCGDLDMRIAADATWFYQKTPIGRPALVRLFSSVLKREGDRYFLVTPVEKCGIVVDDAPFLAVEMRVQRDIGPVQGGPSPVQGDDRGQDQQDRDQGHDRGQDHGQVLHFRTNVDEWIACGPDHALRFEPEPGTGGLKPYLHVRRELWAKLKRPLFYDLVELGEEREVAGVPMFGVVSGGAFFAMAPADELRAFA